MNIITRQILLGNDGALGRPLPLLSHWNCDVYKDYTGWSAAKQLEMLKQGVKMLPWLRLPQEPLRDDEVELIQYCKENFLPLSFISTQWENTLLEDDVNKMHHIDGTIKNKISPFGPKDAWGDKPTRYFNNEYFNQVQALYPYPPLVIIISNNESPKMRWHEADESVRFLMRYADDLSEDAIKRLFSVEWAIRYNIMIQAQKSYLSEGWKNCVKFVGYEAFCNTAMGRWGGWDEYTMSTDECFSLDDKIWDGTSMSYYAHNWGNYRDHTVQSPQIESMNMFPQMVDWSNDFWFELSVWDGNLKWMPGDEVDLKDSKFCQYAQDGQDTPPERYKGFAQFGLWLMRPRVLREFRAYTVRYEAWEDYFKTLGDMINIIYNTPTLAEFWQHGQLVEGTTSKNRESMMRHPYQSSIPDRYNINRWYLLDTSLTPPQPWKLDTDLPVYSIAYCIYNNGKPTYLVYAFSPLEDRTVDIYLPDCSINIDVTRSGVFYMVENGKATRVN